MSSIRISTHVKYANNNCLGSLTMLRIISKVQCCCLEFQIISLTNKKNPHKQITGRSKVEAICCCCQRQCLISGPVQLGKIPKTIDWVF